MSIPGREQDKLLDLCQSKYLFIYFHLLIHSSTLIYARPNMATTSIKHYKKKWVFTCPVLNPVHLGPCGFGSKVMGSGSGGLLYDPAWAMTGETERLLHSLSANFILRSQHRPTFPSSLPGQIILH